MMSVFEDGTTLALYRDRERTLRGDREVLEERRGGVPLARRTGGRVACR